MAVQRRIGVLAVSVALVAVGLPALGGAAAQAATRPGPKAVPPPWWPEPRRAPQSQEWKFQVR